MGVPLGACTRIYTVCIWSRHLKLYWRKWRLIQMSLMKHSLYNLNCSFSWHTVTCASITMLCCVTALSLCKIIKKSDMGSLCFLSSETWSSTRLSIACFQFSILDSWFAQESRIVNCVENQDSQQTVNLLLNGTVTVWTVDSLMKECLID